MNTDQLVEAYLIMRNERDRMRHEWEAKDAAVEEEMATIERSLLNICNESNAKSIRTDKGTVIKKVNERYTISDNESFREFVMEHKVPELFQARISQSNFKEFMAEHEGEGLPPGVNIMREFTVVVRKPTLEV